MAYLPDDADIRPRVNGGTSRARSYGFPSAHVTATTPDVLAKLEERAANTDGAFRCYLCGVPLSRPDAWHLDHVIPLILRGPHAADNLEAACVGCNLVKGDLTLEDFLGPGDYKAFLDGGDLPPFQAMRDRPVAELWARSPAVARRFARRPREVPKVGWEGRWNGPTPAEQTGQRLDVAIAQALVAQNDAWRAVSTKELARLIPHPVTALDDNYWLRAMGLNDRPGMEGYHDNRLFPSPLVMPVRVHGQSSPVGRKAFRLRTGADPSDIVLLLEGSTMKGRQSLGFPDQDELA